MKRKGRPRCDVRVPSLDTGDPALPVAGQGRLAGVRRSRTTRWRVAALVLLHVAIAAHITHWVVAGRSVSPVEPSESMYTLELGQLNAGFVFFVVAILLTALVGRFVCGWGCHLLALQDLCGGLMKRVGIRPRPFRSRALAWGPFAVAFLMFVWPTIARLTIERREFPGFSNHFVTGGFWDTFPGPWMATITFLVCGFAAVWFLGAKGFCTYACPYGAFFAAADRVSPLRIVVNDDCEQCGHCTVTCTSNVRVHEEVREHGRVVDPGCMKCMDCVSVCPKNALSLGWARPALFDRRKGARPRREGLGLGSELLVAGTAVASALVFRGLYSGPYGGPGLLLAVALGGITGFVALKVLQLVRRPRVSLNRFALKETGRLSTAGRTFAVLAVLWLAFTAHSGAVQWQRARGNAWLARTEATREDVFGGGLDAQTLSARHHEAVERAHAAFSRAERWGLLPMLDVRTGLAWTALLLGETEAALEHLEGAIALAPENVSLRRDRVRLLAAEGRLADALVAAEALGRDDAATAEDHFVRAGLYVAADRPADAAAAYRAVLEKAPDSFEARYNLGGVLRRLDRPREAIAELDAAAALDPTDRDTQVELGLAHRAAGDLEQAVAHLERAIALAPDHPESRYHLPGVLAEIRAEIAAGDRRR